MAKVQNTTPIATSIFTIKLSNIYECFTPAHRQPLKTPLNRHISKNPPNPKRITLEGFRKCPKMGTFAVNRGFRRISLKYKSLQNAAFFTPLFYKNREKCKTECKTFNEKDMKIGKITSQIIFDHHTTAHKKGVGYIEIRVTYNRKAYYFGTGIKCRKSEWVAGQVVNCPGAREMNERLAIIYSKVLAEINACLKEDRAIVPDEIRDKVYSVAEAQDGAVFIDWCRDQIPLLGVSAGTAKHYYPLINRLSDFGRIQKWDDLTVENICNFDVYLHSLTKPMSDARMKGGAENEKLSDAAVYNYHKTLKRLLNRACLFEKIEANPYWKLKGQFKRGEKESVEFLTREEMKRFEALQLPAGSPLDVAHDLFIFQMYTGLSYSDCQAFDLSQYKWDGKQWTNVGERIKTGVSYVSVLLPQVESVLKKYGWQVPKMENHEYNRYLKVLGPMANITTRMHTHLARHTFATQMLSNDVKIQNVSKMLGHKNITQTQRYAKVLAQDVKSDFEKVAKKLTK